MRRELTPQRWEEISRQIQDPALPLDERAALRLRLFLEEEDAAPVDSPIPLARSIIRFPDIYAPGEAERLRQGCHIHEQGRVCNLSSDWEGVLRGGLLAAGVHPTRRTSAWTRCWPLPTGWRIPPCPAPSEGRENLPGGAVPAAAFAFRALGQQYLSQYAGPVRPVHVPLLSGG